MEQMRDLELLLHGTWSEGALFIWGEWSAPALTARKVDPPVHPYAASPSAIREALQQSVPLDVFEDAFLAQRIILLPSDTEGPRVPSWLRLQGGGASQDVETNGELVLAPWRVDGLALDVSSALDLLTALPGLVLSDAARSPVEGRDRLWGEDLCYWGVVAKLCLELLCAHKYLAGIVHIPEAGGAPRYEARWLPVLSAPHDRARLHALVQSMPPVCRAVRTVHDKDLPLPHTLLERFVHAVIDEAVRDWGYPRLDRRRRSPQGIAGLWWDALWRDDPQIDVPATQARSLVLFYDAWREWFDQLHAGEEAAFRLCFRLEPPEIDTESSVVASSEWTLRYMLQANDDPSLLVPVEQVWSARGGTLYLLERRFEGAQEQLLAGLGLAARIFPPILDSLRTARPETCALSVDDAYAFLREVGPLLQGSGFGVLVPPWWNKPGARLAVRAKLRTAPAVIGQGILNMNSLVQFDWELALGGEKLTREELERLAVLKMPLVQVRGQWVLLQSEEIESAIAFWEKKQQDQLRLRDALGLTLGATEEIGGLPVDGVETSGWLDDLLRELQSGQVLEIMDAPQGFVGQLRPYQVRGYSWLAFLRRWGLGACLADDMGLGKTIQAIALLLHERENNDDANGPALLICPTSVVGNWKREINRFAPSLRAIVHHGGDRARGEDLFATAQEHDVVISTYGLARRDVDDLGQVQWSDVILDEAQNIKNPQAKQTRAICSLEATNRVALTGTPVENRLSELWSIMHFLNPGYLGSQAGFRKTYALPIERYGDQDATERLKGLIKPFVLRRVKTDASIIQDLPEKLESKVYCNLTPEQATLYEAVVRDSMQRIESADEAGIKRRGVVLSALMRLKQVCNHPAQFLGDGSVLPGRSGKLNRLGEMLEEALSVGDRALVFTQFAEMGHMLQAHLRALFGVEVLFLHGGTPQKQRDRMVDRFQQERGGPPIFCLSLKAGGTGLNLTAANHVFHFDRWWNPAVENQATDRAFRIGQTRDVQVFKYICAGTLEERIDELIESKMALAESVVGGGEGWLTELSTDELHSLMTLREE